MLKTPGYLLMIISRMYVLVVSSNIVHHRRAKRSVLSKPFWPDGAMTRCVMTYNTGESVLV